MTIEAFLEVAQPIVESRNLFIVDKKITAQNDIELVIDALEGVNISTCIEVSREIESHFDRDQEDFSLTVSSAGIGYPFKVPMQYEKNLEKLVVVKMDDNKKLTGILKSYTPSSIDIAIEKKVAIEGKKRKEVVTCVETISLEHVKEVRDEIVF